MTHGVPYVAVGEDEFHLMADEGYGPGQFATNKKITLANRESHEICTAFDMDLPMPEYFPGNLINDIGDRWPNKLTQQDCINIKLLMATAYNTDDGFTFVQGQ